MPSGKHCITCGKKVQGYSPLAGYVKCDNCRTTPAKRQRHSTDVEGKVRCQLCGIVRKRLSQHITGKHGMSVQQYQEQFPGVQLFIPRPHSEVTKEKMRQKALTRWEDPAEIAAQSERLKGNLLGRTLTPEHRAAISRGGKGKKHNLTPEGLQIKRKVGTRNLRAMQARPEHPQKCAQGVRKRIENGELVGFMDPETCRKSLESRLRNGTFISPNSSRGITGWRRGLLHYCRSTLEANFSRILNHEGIRYVFEPNLFKLPSGRYYTPDFWLYEPLKEIPAGWVELKGWRYKDGTLPGNTGEKIEEFEGMVDEVVFVLTQQDPLWKELEAEYSRKLDLWELPRRNLRTHPDIFGVVEE